MQKGDTVTIETLCTKDHLSLICSEISHLSSVTEGRDHDSSILSYQSSIKLKDAKGENVEHLSRKEGYPDLDRIDLSCAGSTDVPQENNEARHLTAFTTLTHKNCVKTVTLEEHDVGVLNDVKTQSALLSAIQNIVTKFKFSSSNATCFADENNSVLGKAEPESQNTDKSGGIPASNLPKTKTAEVLDFQSKLKRTKLSVLDLSDVLSLTALYALRSDDTTYACITQPNQDTQHVLQCIGESNGIDIESSVTFETKSDVLYPKCNALWDVVIVDPVEPTGVLRQQVLEDIAVAR